MIEEYKTINITNKTYKIEDFKKIVELYKLKNDKLSQNNRIENLNQISYEISKKQENQLSKQNKISFFQNNFNAK